MLCPHALMLRACCAAQAHVSLLRARLLHGRCDLEEAAAHKCGRGSKRKKGRAAMPVGCAGVVPCAQCQCEDLCCRPCPGATGVPGSSAVAYNPALPPWLGCAGGSSAPPEDLIFVCIALPHFKLEYVDLLNARPLCAPFSDSDAHNGEHNSRRLRAAAVPHCHSITQGCWWQCRWRPHLGKRLKKGQRAALPAHQEGHARVLHSFCSACSASPLRHCIRPARCERDGGHKAGGHSALVASTLHGLCSDSHSIPGRWWAPQTAPTPPPLPCARPRPGCPGRGSLRTCSCGTQVQTLCHLAGSAF